MTTNVKMIIHKLFNLKFVLSLLLILTFITGCKKDLSNGNGSIAIKEAVNSIPSYPFENWETIDYMPGTSIPMPWNNGPATGFQADIRYDFKRSEGWNVLYNAFNPNPSLLMPNPYFILYNRYRGLLRIYTYVNTNGFLNSDYLTSKLSLSPNIVNSSMLNYIGHDIIDLSTNQPAANKVEAAKMSPGTWYASQFEMAYDPKVASSTYTNLGLQWAIGWNSISQMTIFGTDSGTVKGTITTPATPGWNLASIGKNLFQGALEFGGLSEFTNVFGKGDELDPMGKAISSGISSALSGSVKNIFSGIFGGSASTQQVALTISTNIKLNGTSTSSGSLNGSGWQIGMPGTSNSQSAPGIVPAYDYPLGIFSLSNKPTVYIHRNGPTQVETDYGLYYEYQDSYTKNPADIITFNPSIINNSLDGATISNLKNEIVLNNPRQLGGNGNGQFANYFDGRLESYNGANIYTSNTDIYIDCLTVRPWLLQQAVYVRISFNVVPNNGGPTCMIVKTFLPNIVIR